MIHRFRLLSGVLAAMLVVGGAVGLAPVAEADEALTVSGVIYDPAGKVVAGASITAAACSDVACLNYTTYAKTTSDAVGHYEISQSLGLFQLIVEAPSTTVPPLAATTARFARTDNPNPIRKDVRLLARLIPTAQPAIDGVCQYGRTLTGNPGTWPTDVTVAYLWTTYGHDGSYSLSVRTESTEQSLTVPISQSFYYDVGWRYTDLTLTLVVSAPGFGDYQTTLVCSPTRQPAYSVTTPPTISGEPIVGQYLTVDPGVWSGTPTEFTYRWYVNGRFVGTGTDRRKLVTGSALGQVYTVDVLPVSGPERPASRSVRSGPTSVVLQGPAASSTSAPTILGDPRVGMALTVNPGTWDVPDLSYTCQWLKDGTPDGAMYSCGSPRILTQADFGHTFATQVYASRSGYAPARATSSTVTVGPGDPPTNSALPMVKGTAQLGQTLTATLGTWTGAASKFSYQWLADETPIAGQTSPSYAIALTDQGKKFRVQVTATSGDYVPVKVLSPSTATVTKRKAPVANVQPAITGTAQVGQSLTVSSGTWTQSITPHYQWLADGVAIPGATRGTFTAGVSLLTKRLSVRVTVTSALYEDGMATTLPTAAVSYGPRPVNTILPTISGTPYVTGDLRAYAGEWDKHGVENFAYSYTWYRDGAVISSGANSYLKVVAADLGHRISVHVTLSKPGYNSASAKSASSGVVGNAPPTVKTLPAISGTASVGRTVTATPGVWSRTGLTFTYAWVRSGSTAVIGTGTTYVLTAADQVKTITVAVTASSGGSPTRKATSAPTAQVTQGTAPTSTAAPAITGKTIVGQTLTSTHGSWSTGGLIYSYQWTRNGSAISGATKTTYLLTKPDQGSRIGMTVTVKKAGYQNGTAKAAPTAIITAK
ncbi:hypothetical protein B7R21_06205 [Subtercola boreus]|uniref:Alpha-amylase n=1 Tax=Subtercola boreus TaxID=120213 RepID=A0A3E0VZ61_9MICO|nr:hypothetical protein [Subtercola boreus]RFA14628.1 hypothetical protein B7R21_06205 [Subtercola boreus]